MLSVTLFIVMSGPIISSVIMLSVASLIDTPIVIMLSVVVLCVSAHFKKAADVTKKNSSQSLTFDIATLQLKFIGWLSSRKGRKTKTKKMF
jgi:hypothetical protein